MKKGVQVDLKVDLQCGSCGALTHQGQSTPRFCLCCGAGYERYCIACCKRVPMFFEEYWPTDEECVRTYSPAKKCPHCKAGLEVARDGLGDRGERFGARRENAHDYPHRQGGAQEGDRTATHVTRARGRRS